MEQVLFVFYKGEGSWSYNLPKGWWFVGSGSTSSMSYPREEQFQGPKATKKKAKDYLDKFFTNLKKKGVSIYKIRESYKP
jgi:hypothetical protein